MMKITHEKSNKKGSFLVEEKGERLGQLDYRSSAEGEITIYHTEVDTELRGEGIGGDLVAAAVEFAREKDLKIIATCPYARKVIAENPKFQDILV